MVEPDMIFCTNFLNKWLCLLFHQIIWPMEDLGYIRSLCWCFSSAWSCKQVHFIDIISYAKAWHLQGIFFFLLDLNAKNVLLHSYISFPLAVVYIYCTFLFEIVTTFQAKIFVWLWFKKWYKFKILLSSFICLRTVIFLLNFIHFYSFSNKCTFK